MAKNPQDTVLNDATAPAGSAAGPPADANAAAAAELRQAKEQLKAASDALAKLKDEHRATSDELSLKSDALRATGDELADAKKFFDQLRAGAGIGAVLEEDATHETVVVRRKKAARPTGRFRSNANYRFGDDTKPMVKDADGKDTHPSVMIPHGTFFERDSIPEKVLQHGIDTGVFEEERA